MTTTMPPVVEAYLGQAIDGRGGAGVRLALDLLDAGTSTEQVVTEVLAVAQTEVGIRWLSNQYTVADEHLASGVTQRALDAVASTIDEDGECGKVVVACAEGDWHSLPAQMFAELLRGHGFSVSFLGASTPVDHVEALLGRRPVDALAVSCSVPLFFEGVTRLATAAHRQGVPVIAGGRALGSGDRRARSLGADAWALGAGDGAPIISGWCRRPPELVADERARPDALVRLTDRVEEIVDVAFADLTSMLPMMRSYGADQLSRTREDLAFIVRFAHAALQVDDPTVLYDFIEWLQDLLVARGVPSSALDHGLAALEPALADVSAVAATLAGEARALVNR